jgi:5S rRNA maturation endonuclease (ribonuclease M5)
MTIVDEIKGQIDLAVLVSETASVKLKKSGKGWVGFCPFHSDRHKPSLVVYPPNAKGNWHWKCFSCNEGGSQIDWMKKKNPGWDDTEAIRQLAKRAGIDVGTQGGGIFERTAASKKRSALRVAMDVFKRWLVGSYGKDGKVIRAGDATALSYALDRGWTMGTIENGGLLGFTGRRTPAEYEEMRGEFQLNGIDLLSPEAVMVLGFQGNVAEWAKKQGLDPAAFADNYISGFMDHPALVYAHKFDGRVEYLSARLLPGFDEKRKSHNPNAGLIGDRRAFRNSLYRHHHADGQEKGALLYIVEGQGDAKTFEQVGLPAVALCGSAWEYLVESGEINDWLKDYEELIYVTDADTAGEKVVTGKNNDYAMMNALGAMLWVGRIANKTWTRPDGLEKTIKDVNDIAQYLKDTQADEKVGNALYNEIAMKAKRIVVLAAQYAGTLEGNARTQMIEKVMRPMILSIPEEKRTDLTRDLAYALYPNVSKATATADFNKWLRVQVKSAANATEKETKLPEVETYGGWYPDSETKNSGHLVELFYDRKAGKIRLAWVYIKDLKNNVREIGWGKGLTLENKILVPPVFDQLIQENIDLNSSAIKMPTGVGEKFSTGELIKKNSDFYASYFYTEDKSKFKFSGSWSLNTWVHDCFDTMNFLRMRGPAGSGKSDLAYLVGLTSYRFAVTAAVTTGASHVGMAKIYNATTLMDEYDSMMKRDDGTIEGFLKARPMRRIAHAFKMMEVMTPNGKTFIPSNTPIYGATILTGYKPFQDKGIESRCMTFDLARTDMLTLDQHDFEPGYYPPELEEDAEQIRNACLRWRLETWMPRIELTAEQRKAHKLNDVLVSARENQLLRPMKVMAVVQNDMQLLEDLFKIGRANYEDELLQLSGSFEAMVMRAALAADIAKDVAMGIKPQASAKYAERVKGYAELVKVGKLGKYGVVRYILYKDIAKILNEIFDLESIDESEEDKKRRKKTQSKTAGDVCRDAFRMPVMRTGAGFVVILSRERLDIARMRLGLDREPEYDPNYVEEIEGVEVVAEPEPVQVRMDEYVPSENAVWLDEHEEEME